MLNVAVTEVGLQSAGVVALIGHNRTRATDVNQLQNADNHIAMKNEAVNFKI
jgi:hypothetical protein